MSNISSNIIYAETCTEHSDMLLLEDERLVKVGDKFDTHNEFVQYLNENAKRWCFYYKCSDSRKSSNGQETYTYNCVYRRNKEKYQKKGLRKRNNSMKTECPCKIKLTHLPNETELTVVYVCNHHDHELSPEQFHKLQHGRRLPPYVKEEIMDFMLLNVDGRKIRKYVELETGFIMSRPFFYTLKKIQKTKHFDRQITEERLKMLKDKIAAVEEMLMCDNEDDEQNDDYGESSESHLRAKTKRYSKDKDEVNRLKKSLVAVETDEALHFRWKTVDTNKSIQDTSVSSKHMEVEEMLAEVNTSETIQSVRNLQDSVKCEIQKNPWVSDQCIPALPNRTTMQDESPEDANPDPNTVDGDFTYEIAYFSPEQNTEDHLIHIINEDHTENGNESNIENIAYETVVTEYSDSTNVENYVTNTSINNDQIPIYIVKPKDANDTNEDTTYTEDVIEMDPVEQIAEESEQIVQFINENIEEIDEDNVAHDVGVQTSKGTDNGQTLLPVFDVYMKDGNVTGFVVNNNLINGVKEGADKGVQASDDIIYSDVQDIENEDIEIIKDFNEQDGEIYTKHEYVHKYNIDQYMSLSHFPRYVEILAKETNTDVLNMFANIYSERAMFKLTTTQKGKEGNTRIRYITHNGKIKKKKMDDAKRQKLGKRLHSVFILKEKMRILKKENEELLRRNKYLENIGHKYVKLG